MIIKLTGLRNGCDVLVNTDQISSVSVNDQYHPEQGSVIYMKNGDQISVVESVHHIYLEADGQ